MSLLVPESLELIFLEVSHFARKFIAALYCLMNLRHFMLTCLNGFLTKRWQDLKDDVRNMFTDKFYE